MIPRQSLQRILAISSVLGLLTLDAVSMGTEWRPAVLIIVWAAVICSIAGFFFSWHGVRAAIAIGDNNVAQNRASFMLAAAMFASIFALLHILEAAMFVMDMSASIPREILRSSDYNITPDVRQKLGVYSLLVFGATILAAYALLAPMVMLARRYERLTRNSSAAQ